MNSKSLFWLLITILLITVPFAEAQQTTKTPVIGILYGQKGSPESPEIDAFRQQLRQLGYLEGKTIYIEYRFLDGEVNRVPDIASQLLGLGTKIIVTSNMAVVRLIREMSESIPVVMVASADPPDVIETLSKPGRNVTGSFVSREISGKQLELLKETVPRLKKIIVLFSQPPNTILSSRFIPTKIAAEKLGLEFHPLVIQDLENLRAIFQGSHRGSGNGLLLIGSPLFNTNRKLIIAFAEKNRLPAIYHRRYYVEDGGLMSYGPDSRELWRQSAFQVDKILKGAKPGDLPAEQATKLELVINLKAAQKIGLRIPDEVLRWADEVIE